MSIVLHSDWELLASVSGELEHTGWYFTKIQLVFYRVGRNLVVAKHM